MKLLTYLFPILTVLLLLALFLTLPDLRLCLRPMDTPSLPAGKKKPRLYQEDRSRSLTRGDLLPILLITLVYAIAAFFRLGGTVDPQTFVPMQRKDVTISLPEGEMPSQLVLYPGVGMGGYTVFYSEDGEVYEQVASFTQDHVAVLKWARVTPETSLRPRFIRLVCDYGEPWLGEVLVLDGDGQPLPYGCDVPELCDEQETMPRSFGFQNSSYFDEIYHARTAWEHLNRVYPYEITHPPLGKEIIGLGILLFGMTPFGWRFSGTLFGVLMLPLLYVPLKKLFGGRLIPALGTLIFAADFMHYVQTRIATIDTYSVFFILLMYLFLYLWLSEDRLWALALCGVSFGLGAAAKWTSIYAGAGLALLWLVHWIGRFRRARRERMEPEQEEAVLPAFLGNVLFCLVFFIVVPGLIYLLSYIPYALAQGTKIFSREYLILVWNNQVSMFTYHSKTVLGSTHPYSSTWYQWLIDYRPILYVLEYPTADTRISIAAWLNPVLCWGGLMSLPVLGWMAIARRDRRAAFILVGYLSQLLPWVPVARLTFAYHYFPSALFLVLSLSYILALLRENRPNWRVPAISLAVGSAAVFLLFFPVLNGLPVDAELISSLCRWLPSWPI
jgi:hypothetical protein